MLISVYIPTKNRLALLQRAVASVLAQSHRELELIVVDDGSTDGTAVWLEQQSAQDGRLRFLRHPQSLGAPAARNKAILAARGEWITGLDDDDQFTPERLAMFVKHVARLDGAGEHCSGLYSFERIETGQRTHTLDKPAQVAFQSLFHYNHIGNQIFARRSHYIDAGLFDEAMPAWQDLDLFLRMLHRCGPARLVPHSTYVLADDDRPDRISRKTKAKLLEAYGRIAGKWPQVAPIERQRLYLQLLAPFYRVPLQWADLRRYFGMGVSLAAAAHFTRLLLHRWSA